MAYSVLGIYNQAFARIGQPKQASLSDNTTPIIQANLAWEYIRDEVLEAHDWTFAKTRVALAKNATSPSSRYAYAYTLPADFLKIAKQNPDDPPVYPASYPYILESLPDGTQCLFTDYDNSDQDLYLTYIRREENPARYTATFCSAAAFRLGAELALVITESQKKFEALFSLYEQAITKAKGLNNSSDYLQDETGSTAWELAGRGTGEI